MKKFMLDLLKKYSPSKNEFLVEGISMEPFLEKGDVVGIEKSENFKIGDVIVFIYEDKLLVHRLIKYSNNIYWCKGDNAWSFERVNKEDILGRVVYKKVGDKLYYVG